MRDEFQATPFFQIFILPVTVRAGVPLTNSLFEFIYVRVSFLLL